MPDPSNPYLPPSSDLGTQTLGEDGFLPDGNLTRAVEGEVRLQTIEAFKEGWARVPGTKLPINIAMSVVFLIYMVGFGVYFAAAFMVAGINFDLLSDPIAFNEQLTGLSTNPIYLLTTSLVFAPVNALSYLAMWNLGVRRAAGHELSVGDAFPMAQLGKALVVMLMLVPFSLLGALHPLAGYLSLPIWLVVFWTLPLFLDREVSIGEALGHSAQLTRHNVLSLLGLGLAAFAIYMVSALTCGIAFIWTLPWICTTLGAAWRQLAGLEQVRVA